VRVVLVAEQLRRAVPGGIGTYVRGLLQGLAELDDPDVGLEVVRSSPDGRRGSGSLAERLPSPVVTRLWDSGLAVGVPRRAGAATLLHAPSLAVPPWRGPLSVTVHDLAWRSVPEAFPARGRRWHEGALARALARRALLLTPSEAVAVELRATGARAVVVPEGADHLPPPDLDAARDLLGRRAGGDGPFVLSVGTLEPRKNLGRTVAAYRKARPSLPGPWPLVIAGPAGWAGELARLEATAGPDVVLVGPVAQATLAGLYALARCLVFVPVLEGYGLPPLEAMRLGTPVVASPLPSLAGTDAALVVPSDDVDAIADAILAAASDEATRASLAERGVRLAASRTWRESARQHVAAWRAMLEEMEVTA
jgi:glycosyltransferase involved in cell wall biosynthesis